LKFLDLFFSILKDVGIIQHNNFVET